VCPHAFPVGTDLIVALVNIRIFIVRQMN